MAKLSTPFHKCEQEFRNAQYQPIGQRCPYAAYRKGSDGKWYCRSHNRARKARETR